MEKYKFRDIGDRLKALRDGLSQSEFAAKLGIKQQQYNRYETGKVKPPLNILMKLSLLKTVSTDWILTGKQTTTDLSEVSNSILPLLSRIEAMNQLGIIPKASISTDELTIIKCLRILSKDSSLSILIKIVNLIAKEPTRLEPEYEEEQVNALRKIIKDKRLFEHGIDYDGLLFGYKQLEHRLAALKKEEQKYVDVKKTNNNK